MELTTRIIKKELSQLDWVYLVADIQYTQSSQKRIACMFEADSSEEIIRKAKRLHKKFPGGTSKIEGKGNTWFGTYAWSPGQEDTFFVGAECSVI